MVPLPPQEGTDFLLKVIECMIPFESIAARPLSTMVRIFIRILRYIRVKTSRSHEATTHIIEAL